jgi:hypothetical protein
MTEEELKESIDIIRYHIVELTKHYLKKGLSLNKLEDHLIPLMHSSFSEGIKYYTKD